MPYYCTVPRCTSMAGKAKNVSFHQFPRDEELARLWNDILKRGKPYTKYSKVCSLHFKPEDYTITSVGKNKGQWRTLRKDAVPSQNLPSETPAPYSRKQWDSWNQGQAPVMDPSIQHQMAQAIYMQTMMAMQAAGTEPPIHQNGPKPELPNTSYHEDLKLKQNDCTYRCTDCTKCFKDPDVFILHKRTHAKDKSEKENFNVNLTLRSNPILANLLKTDNFDPNVVSMENLLLSAIAANMDYMRNYSNIKEENFDGFDNRRESYENREDNSDGGPRIDENRDVDRNRNRFNTETVNRSYRNDCRSNPNAIYDLNRLKSDLNRRSVEIHVRSDLTHASTDYVDVKDDLTLSKGDSNQVTESVIGKSYMERQNHSENHNGDTNSSESNGERIYQSENVKNEQENNVNCVENQVNGYAMNFTSQTNQIPYKASFYRESFKNASIVDEESLLEPNCSLQYENFSSTDENCSKSILNNITSCDNDMNESLDSNTLVIDESV